MNQGEGSGTTAREGRTGPAVGPGSVRALEAPLPPKVAAGSAGGATAAADVETPLGREMRSLDGARGALARGDSAAALAALDRHDRAFPAGALSTESSVLRVEALLAHDDVAAARSLARRNLTLAPSGPHARRMQTIADGGR